MQTKNLAILGLILAFLIPLAGFIVGIIALSRINKQGGEGKGVAIAAVAISCIGMILVLIFVIPFVFVIIGSLSYFGVMEPGNFVPERCELQMGLNCIDYKPSAFFNNMEFSLQNTMGKGIILTSMSTTGLRDAAGITCTNEFSEVKWEPGKPGAHMSNGDSLSVTLDCTGSLSELKGDAIQRFDIEVVYYNDDAEPQYSHTMKGSLMAYVKP
ncbi:MAG: DUF4190 domain-containing protein [bacterium]|nr:DUF4190 domain-containing protein [bacterium]